MEIADDEKRSRHEDHIVRGRELEGPAQGGAGVGNDFEGVREVARLMGPRVVGLAITQLNFLVNTILASGLPRDIRSPVLNLALLVVQRGAVFRREGVDVFLGKKEVAEIEDLEVTGEEFARNLVVQRVVGVMAFLQQSANRDANIVQVGLCRKRWR